MSDAVLVVNAGSATLKYALYSDALQCVLRGLDEGASHEAMIAAALARAQAEAGMRIVAAGHRVVHGGDWYAEPTPIDAAVLARLERLCPLAPLHQPHNLAGIRAVSAQRPQVPQVACFDTAFHQSQPELARRFALPRALHDAGVKRYGFHGLSYEYIARRLPELPEMRGRDRAIVAHLGNGASLCAMRNGRSVASTMGFTTLDGLMMGTRTGAIDPGVLLYLIDEKRMSSRDLARLLYRESGLLGVSGISHDMRTLLASDDPNAKLAVDLYAYRVARELGSLAAALGGLDALIFTAGIGEHAAPVRDAICAASRWIGIDADPAKSRVAVLVVPTNEEEMIARHTLETLGRISAGAPS
ncbi:MAG: acetate/propionate family kinase [Burkholderiales bacterium]|nr:acetate/propionate family kinase [Burkholderiales bacterium]